MSVNVTFNNQAYVIPEARETGWAAQVTSWIQAVSQAALSRAGGSFPLTAEVDFGASFGVRATNFKSRASDVATTGQFRLGYQDQIGFRNATNTGNNVLGVNAANELTWNGNAISLSASYTPSRAVITNASGIITTATATSTEVGHLVGVTSAIQTQLNARGLAANGTFTDPTLTRPIIEGPRPALRTVTGTASAATTDSFVEADATSAAFTFTLFAASGNSGAQLTIRKTDSTFNAVTVTDGSFSTTLNTQNEVITVRSNGTAWAVVSRIIRSAWVATPVPGTAIGNSTRDAYFWRRVGENVEIQLALTATGAASGDWASVTASRYLPNGLSIDTSKIAYYLAGGAPDQSVVGTFETTDVGVGSFSGVVVVATDGTIEPRRDGAGFHTVASGDGICFRLSVPITGWNA